MATKILLFPDSEFRGKPVELFGDTPSLNAVHLNDAVSSAIVEGGTWTLHQDADFQGYSVTVSIHGGPSNNGRYPNSSWLGGRNDAFSSIRKNSDLG